MKYVFKSIAMPVIAIIILALALRGWAGNPGPKQMLNSNYVSNGPLELSPERGRFALTYAMVENHSLSLSIPLAKFSTPDLGFLGGKYVSLFAPGVSFITLPGFFLGSLINLSQVGTYSIIAIFGFLNFLLIKSISKFLGASNAAAYLSAFVYLFATPAFAYSVSLYEHQISVFFLLMCLYIALKYNSWKSLLLIWTFIGCAFTVDYPNIVMLAPIGIYALIKTTSVTKNALSWIINIRLGSVLTGFAIFIPLFLLVLYNVAAYHSPTQLSSGLPSVDSINAKGKPISNVSVKGKKVNLFTYAGPLNQGNSVVKSFFNPRNLINGFYIHFISNQRGVIYFTPVIILSIFGIIFLYRNNATATSLMLSIIGVNVLLYSMWGDPWGGWAFGSRYLIPTYSLLAIFLSVILSNYVRKKWFLTIFVILLGYSIFVNTIGAITSNKIPPQQEAESLSSEYHISVQYTYGQDISLLNQNISKSFIYHDLLYHYLTAWEYGIGMIIIIYAAAGADLYILWKQSPSVHKLARKGIIHADR